MSLRYMDYMSTISSDKLHEGLFAHGMFTEKLPPIFTSENFFNSIRVPQMLSPKACAKSLMGLFTLNHGEIRMCQGSMRFLIQSHTTTSVNVSLITGTN